MTDLPGWLITGALVVAVYLRLRKEDLRMRAARQPTWNVKTVTVPHAKDVQVIALVKGNERYVFLYDEATRGEALRTLKRFAANPDLSFSDVDEEALSRSIEAKG